MTGAPWLIREPDPSAPARLLCFPVSGVGATQYRFWPERIGRYEVCPVQLPGRENRIRERRPATMEELGGLVAEALAPVLDRPYSVFGHCFGARVAHAVITSLADRGARLPGHFFASGCLAPHQGGRFGPFSPETTDEDYAEGLRQGCRERGEPVPPPELIALSIRVLRTDVALSCAYTPPRPQAPLLDITTIGWSADAHVAADSMGEWAAYGVVRHVVLDGDDSAFRACPQELLDVLTSTPV